MFTPEEDETAFHIEDAAPEAVVPGLLVTIRYPDDNTRKTIVISDAEHRPEAGLIQVDKPLAQALLGASVGEEIDLVVGERTRCLVIEKILAPQRMAAE